MNPMWWRRFSAKKPERRLTRPAPAPWGNHLRPNPTATRPSNRPATRYIRRRW
ncbi:hypothetical protein [Nocardia sp. XZ_19_385]|uniref:hypothetical protein n=1 Tax=Nocardia sp. XZ_19_385 TaxID=2769488 RepID=UPI0018900160|nr:hypothetical protein [Nocardia sp. XZ_19_385]